MHRFAWTVVVVACSWFAAHSQAPAMHSSAGHDAEHATHAGALPAVVDAEVTLRAQLVLADPAKRGELWLKVSADAEGAQPAHVTLRIPLSSTEDVYGESRSCKMTPGGAPELTFTAGMDENNFLRFAIGDKQQEIRLLLNKYLCRALAAPFHCDGREVTLPEDWSKWRMATATSLILTSDAPATLRAAPVGVATTGSRFDPASCAVIAPSNGMCCVAEKSTEWHCGGTPAGAGWHQVSGECFHRETGGQCTDKTVFSPLLPSQ